jgi:hypothetical protein
MVFISLEGENPGSEILRNLSKVIDQECRPNWIQTSKFLIPGLSIIR